MVGLFSLTKVKPTVLTTGEGILSQSYDIALWVLYPILFLFPVISEYEPELDIRAFHYPVANKLQNENHL